MSAPSLDPFPDLCLIAIFMHLPLSNLLAVIGLVCGRWRALLPTVLARHRSLKIVQADLVDKRFGPDDYLYGNGRALIYRVRRDDGSPWLVRPEVNNRNVVLVPSVIASPNILTAFADGLLDSLPNITSLTIGCHRNVTADLLPELFTQISNMLNHWQDSLVSLNLSIRFPTIIRNTPTVEIIAPFVRNMFESIDRIQTLRHLNLNCDFPRLNFEPELSIFCQLHTFTYSDRFDTNWILPSLRQHTNPALTTRITVNSCVDLHELVQFSPQMASRCTMASSFCLIAQFHEGSLDMFARLCARFTSIQYLRIRLAGNVLHTISPNLAPLQHLVNLELMLYYGFPRGHRQLSPVNSVRALTIKMVKYRADASHLDIESLWLAQLFPNVQVLDVEHNSLVCADCGYQLALLEQRPELWPTVHECKRMARQALTRFPNVHTIRLVQYPSTRDGTLLIEGGDIFDSVAQL